MDNPTVKFITGIWETAVENWFDRATRAIKESENGVYSPRRFLSDSIASSKDFTVAWCAPANVLTQPYTLSVQVAFKSGDGEGVGAKGIPDPGTDQLEWSDLTGPGTIGFAHVEAHLSVDRRVLIVRVFGLKSPAQGLYTGSVNTKGSSTNIIANIECTVKA